jgi:DNA-binding response OmpR family regulator
MTQGQPPQQSEDRPSAEEQALLYARDLARTQTAGPLRRRLAAQAGKILLVDDEASLRLLVSTTLATQNFEIYEAARGDEALILISRLHPRLVLLDIKLPDISGIEICRRVKADPLVQDVKIVMLTAMANDTERRSAMEAGADRYLTKPFSPLNLLETVTHLLGAAEKKVDTAEYKTQEKTE